MKKIIIVTVLGLVGGGRAYAANCPVPGCQLASPDSSCIRSDCCSSVTTGPNASGIMQTVTTKLEVAGVGCPTSGTYSCICSTGVATYFCAPGYYGKSNAIGTGGCTRCPDGHTSAGGNGTTITSCYIPSGTSFSDDTGSGTYTNDCYWAE